MSASARPTNPTEAQIIENLVGNSQSTHNEVASNSVGIALLELSARYFGAAISEEQVNASYANTMTELNRIAQTEEQQAGIQYLAREANRNPNQFDVLELYLPTLDGKYAEVQKIFRIKEVISLVWMALNDDSKYAHHYSGTDEARFAAANNDRPARIHELFTCLASIRNQTLCHTGNRNELVFVLNGKYQGIELLEDHHTACLMFVRDALGTHFQEVNAGGDAAIKSALNKELLQWVCAGDHSALLNRFNCREELFNSLRALFIKHGTNPDKKYIDDAIKEKIDNIEFAFDKQFYPQGIEAVRLIFNRDSGDRASLVGRALEKMRNWIMTSYQVSDEGSQEKVVNYHLVQTTYKSLKKYGMYIREAETANGENICEQVYAFCKSYYEGIVAGTFPAVTAPHRALIHELGLASQRFNQDAMCDEIANFFAKWEASKRLNNYPEAHACYIKFIDPLFHQKIILSDQAVSAYQQNGVVDLDAYKINRLFLHAMIIAPEKWSHAFKVLLQEVVGFVSSNFNQAPGLAADLRRDSYSDKLIAQLNYLLARSDDRNIPRPEFEFVLPEHAKSLSDWNTIFKLSGHEKVSEFYMRFKAQADRVIMSAVSAIPVGDENKYSPIQILPRSMRWRFVNQHLAQLVQNGDDLMAVCRIIPADYQLRFLIETPLNVYVKNIDDYIAMFRRVRGLVSNDSTGVWGNGGAGLSVFFEKNKPYLLTLLTTSKEALKLYDFFKYENNDSGLPLLVLVREKYADYIKTIDDFTEWYEKLNPNERETFLHYVTFVVASPSIVKTAKDFFYLYEKLDGIHREALTTMWPFMPSIVNDVSAFDLLYKKLEPILHKRCYFDTMKVKLASLTLQASDFVALCDSLETNNADLSCYLASVKSKLLEITHTAEDMAKIYRRLARIARDSNEIADFLDDYFAGMKDKLPTLMCTLTDCNKIYEVREERHAELLKSVIASRIPHMMVTIREFVDICHEHQLETQHLPVYSIMKTNLPNMIKSASAFAAVFNALTEADKEDFFESFIPLLPNLLHTVDDVKVIYECLEYDVEEDKTDSQMRDRYIDYNMDKITSLIRTAHDFNSLYWALHWEDKETLFDWMLPKLPSLVRAPDDKALIEECLVLKDRECFLSMLNPSVSSNPAALFVQASSEPNSSSIAFIDNKNLSASVEETHSPEKRRKIGD